LPDVRDGLKPVQRRILWAMWDMGLTAGAKFMKSARVTGETMGKYHPHGDMAVYDSLVRMAQDFSLRYPLIQGQGNFGNIDGDSPAAQRYTEVKLSKISEQLLTDIEKETVDWQPNYDNSRLEPKVLPAKLPNLIINGTMGIAVGMATSIPPHNLQEVVEAIVYLLDHPEASIKELMKFIPAPDFPTGGIVYDLKGIEEIYTTGKGSIPTRAVAEIEEKKGGSYQIVITEIPYQVNKADLIVRIAELVQEKKIEGIRDVRDESDREGLRIVIELKSDAAPQKILNQLFKFTDLQKNFYVNMLALVNGIQPQVLSLKDILQAYIDHRRQVIKRRTEFDLKKAKERAHILEGLVKALEVIDKIIATIKKSKDKTDAHQNLVKNFKLTAIQAEAILEMKLQALAALERQKLLDELKEKRKLIAELEDILKFPKRLTEIIKEEVIELKKNFGDERKTKVVATGLKEFKEEDLIAQEENIITLTQAGYIKRMTPTVFRAQRRGGKGLIGFELKEEDTVQQFISANTHDDILFFTDRGRAFQTKAYEIPAGARVAKGKSIHNFLNISASETITAIIASPKNKEGFLVLVTKKGLIKKTPLKDFENLRRTGIWAIKLKSDDRLAGVKLSSGQDEIIITTAFGQAIRFKEKDIRAMGRNASGVLAIKFKNKQDFVASLDVISAKDKSQIADYKLLLVTANGFAKQTFLKEYKIQKRGGSGIIAAKVTDKTGLIVGAHIVDQQITEIIAFSSKGQAIRTDIKNIRLTGRAAQGVKIMDLEKGDKLIGIVCL
jgi:DNA gyrase subunit A